MDKTTWILDKVWETNHEVIERYQAAEKLKWNYEEGSEEWNKYEQLEKHARRYLFEEVEAWLTLYETTKLFVKPLV